MGTVFGIVRHDLGQLLRNPFALVVTLGLIVLPSVYAWYSIVAMWDPYQHTDGLKVALVSEDAGATLPEDLKGEEVNVGDLLVQAVKQDHSFDWQFVDAEQGRRGLESGEYYAEFVVPRDFSETFLSVLSGNPEHPTIEYWVNEKYNAVALEVTDAGAGVVDAIVNRVFSALLADTVADAVRAVAADLVYDGQVLESRVQTKLDSADADVDGVAADLAGAGESIDRWQSAVDAAQATLDQLKRDIPALRDTVSHSTALLADSRTIAHEVDSLYTSALAQGGPELVAAADKVAQAVRDAAGRIEDRQAEVTEAAEAARRALEAGNRLIQELRALGADSEKLDALERENERLLAEVQSLEDVTDDISAAAERAQADADDIARDLDRAVARMEERNAAFNADVLPRLDTSLDALALVLGSLDGACTSLDAQVDQAKALLSQLSDVLAQTAGVLQDTRESLGTVRESLDTARADLASLAGTDVVRKISSLVDIDVKSYGAFMASPVKAELKPVYNLNSYGAGVAPFYTCLAIWVGCFMLIAVIKLEADPKLFPGMRAWQGYLGRLLLFALLALLQGVVVSVGDLVIGVQTVSPAAFVGSALLVAFCFINIVYALAITFKHVGKALAVVFLIVQIPGASGMYPIQLMPDFFQAMYPLLPFTYGMDAMREAIGGFYGMAYAQSMLWLAACGLITAALALLVRPRVLNLNRLFDRKLEYADLYLTEEHGLGSAVVDAPVVATLASDEAHRPQLLARVETFARRYTVVKRAAPVAVIALTAGLGATSALVNPDADGKLIILSAFIAAVVAIFCACVAFEFVYDNLTAQLSRAGVDIRAMHADQLADAAAQAEGEGGGGLGQGEGEAERETAAAREGEGGGGADA